MGIIAARTRHSLRYTYIYCVTAQKSEDLIDTSAKASDLTLLVLLKLKAFLKRRSIIPWRNNVYVINTIRNTKQTSNNSW